MEKVQKMDGAELSDVKVYKTKKYDIFKKLLGNRDNKTEGKIINSISKIGYVVSPESSTKSTK